ncbi:MAG TPA: phage holin family protein [Rubrivivax sp.]
MTEDARPAPQAAAAPAATPGDGALPLRRLLANLAGDLPGILSDRVHLLSLELQRAGIALAQMVALVVAIAVLAVTAWAAMWVGLAAALMAWGLHGGWVIAIVLGLNLGAALIATLKVRSLAALLGLPATVRQLTVAPPAAEATPQGALP